MSYRELGLEQEAWIESPDGGPADVEAFVECPRTRNALSEKTIGAITREPGLGSIEFVGHYAGSVSSAVANIRALNSLAIERGYKVHHVMRSPFCRSSIEADNQKSRYRALWRATRAEALMYGSTEEEWRVLGTMNQCAALHGHFSYRDLEIGLRRVHERVIFVVNVLNLVGPRVAKILCRKYRVDNAGHPGIWRKWARPERFTQYGDWFPDFAHKRDAFERLTQLIKCVKGGKDIGIWEVDLKTRLSWSDPKAHGSGWWHFIRERPSFGTFEVRILPSWPLELLEPAMNDLDAFVQFLIDLSSRGVAAGLENVEDLFQSGIWREICGFNIGQSERIPLRYSHVDWDRDCLQ